MSLESQVADLVTATTTLTQAVNLSKDTLDAKVTAAGTQATNAANSATASANSATASAASAASALNIYGNTAAMNTAATSASTSATNAATSATNAANSATQAAASASSAAALVLGAASNLPSIAPSLNLDFANSKVLDPRITFSRASTAAFYDGKTTAKADENLFLNSNDFDYSSWVKGASAITANSAAAPDGTMTADLLYPTLAGSARGFYHSNAGAAAGMQAASSTISIYVKSSGKQWIGLWNASAGSSTTWFDVANGIVGTVASGISASIVSAGNGWYRCIITKASPWPANACFGLIVSDTDNSTVVTANGTDGVYLWGAQLEQRAFPTAYTPTTANPITNYIPVLQTAASNVARIDHDPVTGECKGLLIEEQRTNLLSYSSDFDNAAWYKSNATVQSNAVVAPDGSLTADTISLQALGYVYQPCAASYAAGASYTWSVHVQSATRAIMFGGATPSGTDVYSSVPVGNGWYRQILTRTFTNAGSGASVQAMVNALTFGVGSVNIWGAQLEAGAFATSYIPTTSAQATRVADAASMTGTNFSSWYRGDEGTIYAESASSGNNATNVSATVFAIHDGSISNRIRFAHAANTRLNVAVNGVDTVSLVSAYTNGTVIKQAGAYKTDDFSYSVSGAAVQLDTSGGLPVVNQMQIGGLFTGRENNGCIKKIAYYPKRLSDSQLQALTA